MIFALTNPIIIGLLSWLGVAVTIIGLWIAIDQIRRAKSAAEAAAEAAKKIERVVLTRERLLELSSAISLIGNARDYLAQKKFSHANIFFDLAVPQCAQVHELLSGSEKSRMHLVVFKLRRLAEDATKADNDAERDQHSVPLAIEAREIIAEMNALSAVLRYQYNQEGFTQ